MSTDFGKALVRAREILVSLRREADSAINLKTVEAMDEVVENLEIMEHEYDELDSNYIELEGQVETVADLSRVYRLVAEHETEAALDEMYRMFPRDLPSPRTEMRTVAAIRRARETEAARQW